MNSGLQAWWLVLLPTEPSCWPVVVALGASLPCSLRHQRGLCVITDVPGRVPGGQCVALVTTTGGFRNMRQLCCFPCVYNSSLLQVRNGLWFCTESGEKKNPTKPTNHWSFHLFFVFLFVFLNSQSLGWVFFFLSLFHIGQGRIGV
jgi:hypothetical protein